MGCFLCVSHHPTLRRTFRLPLNDCSQTKRCNKNSVDTAVCRVSYASKHEAHQVRPCGCRSRCGRLNGDIHSYRAKCNISCINHCVSLPSQEEIWEDSMFTYLWFVRKAHSALSSTLLLRPLMLFLVYRANVASQYGRSSRKIG